MNQKITFRSGGFHLLSLITGMMFLCSSLAYSQIKGKVTDSTGDPLVGVSVAIKGTTKGTQTDVGGNYSIDAANNTVLVFSFVGYETKEALVSDQKNINISLGLDDKLLSEVVVVGYGSQLKKSVTGAVQSIGAREIKDIPVSQIGQKLQGQLAGVQINQTTGRPGQGMNIRIRGQLSVSAGSDPLYVVDGFPITGNIGALNPDEIEDITVLKDASSTSLYGSRAANGVVLITTKKGKSGTARVNFSFQQGFSAYDITCCIAEGCVAPTCTCCKVCCCISPVARDVIGSQTVIGFCGICNLESDVCTCSCVAG
jgi:TonB-dependent SusC/RagA subfamily outer membrane receptor